MCRSGCPTQDHASWCVHVDPRKRQAYFQRLFDEGKWVCSDCNAVLPLSSFYLRKSGRAKGKPTAARCRVHVSQNDRRRDWQYNVDYETLLAAQGGVCAICGTEQPRGKGRFHVDHDHSCCSGKRSCGRCVRGLLCQKCNTGIGYFNDNVDLMRKAIEYVAR